MAISGVICLGLLDSTSDVLTLGIGPDVVLPPDGPGNAVMSDLTQLRSLADLTSNGTMAGMTHPRSLTPE